MSDSPRSACLRLIGESETLLDQRLRPLAGEFDDPLRSATERVSAHLNYALKDLQEGDLDAAADALDTAGSLLELEVRLAAELPSLWVERPEEYVFPYQHRSSWG